MSIPITCECGRTITVPDEAVGRKVRCKACGKVFQVPVFVPLESSAQPEVADESDAEVAPSRPFWRDPVLVIGSAIPVAILVAFFGYLYVQHAHKARRERILTLISVAEDMLQKGDTRRSFALYNQVLSIAGERPLSDTTLRGYVAAARASRDHLSAAIRTEDEQKAAEMRRVEEEQMARVREADEKRRLASVVARITGGAWVINKLGQSNVLRGLNVYLLPFEIQKGDISDTLKRLYERAIFERAMDESGIRYVHGVDETRARSIIAAAKEKEERAKSLHLLPDESRINTAILYYLTRRNPLGRSYSSVSSDPHWPEIVATIEKGNTRTNIEGKYTLDNVHGGKHILYSVYSTDSALMEWIIPLEIMQSRDYSHDLFNDTATIILNKGDE